MSRTTVYDNGARSDEEAPRSRGMKMGSKFSAGSSQRTTILTATGQTELQGQELLDVGMLIGVAGHDGDRAANNGDTPLPRDGK